MENVSLYDLLIAMYSELTIKVHIYAENNGAKEEIKKFIGSVTSVRVEAINNNDIKLFKVARVFYINYVDPHSKILEISAKI